MAKQSFTYSGDPKIRLNAIKKAKKEKKTFSQLVESLLVQYISEPKDLGVYENFVDAATVKS